MRAIAGEADLRRAAVRLRRAGRRRCRDVACVVRVADCLPIALIAPRGGRRRCTPAGAAWRPASCEAAVAALRGARRGARSARRSGRGARVCCYEAGDEVHAAFAGLGAAARGGRARRPRRRRARRCSSGPASSEVHDTGAVHDLRARRAVLVPPPRGRGRRPAGGSRMAELIHGLDAERVRANLEAVRAEIAAACARAGRDPARRRGARRRQVRPARRARGARRRRASRSPARTAPRTSSPSTSAGASG